MNRDAIYTQLGQKFQIIKYNTLVMLEEDTVESALTVMLPREPDFSSKPADSSKQLTPELLY